MGSKKYSISFSVMLAMITCLHVELFSFLELWIERNFHVLAYVGGLEDMNEILYFFEVARVAGVGPAITESKSVALTTWLNPHI